MFAYGKFGPLVGAIDEGTWSARFIIFKANSSEVVVMCQKELPQCCSREGWLEEEPIVILEAVKGCIVDALQQLIAKGCSPMDIIAIGVTNQRETTIVWDKNTGAPLYNAILWLDLRTSSTVNELLDKVPNNTRNKNYLKPVCGLPLSPHFSAVKLRWLCDSVYAVKEAVKKGTCYFGTVDTWIIWNLTGGVNGGKHVTDVTNASRTMLMNIDNLKWDPFLMKFFDIPQSVLPEIKSSSEVYGYISNGPLAGIPISGCLGDQQAALVGQMCLNKSQAMATYGTACFVLYNTGNVRIKSCKGLLSTLAFQLGSDNKPCYALEGSVPIAGPALGWLRYNEADPQALSEQATANITFVPACKGLYIPFWTKDQLKSICGVTKNTRPNHIVKAALETVSFQVRNILDVMKEDCGIPLQLLKVSGGMTSNPLVMQMQADLIGIDLLRAEHAETTAFGAAMVAFWALDRSKQGTPIALPGGVTFEPATSKHDRDTKYQEWKTSNMLL